MNDVNGDNDVANGKFDDSYRSTMHASGVAAIDGDGTIAFTDVPGPPRTMTDQKVTIHRRRATECWRSIRCSVHVADLALILVVSAALAAVLLVAWRSIRGRPLWRWPRVAIAACAALLVTSYAAWRVSKAAEFQLLGEPIVRVETTSRVVALTFDDGPDPRYVDDILAVLRAERVHATFFVIGSELARHPDLGTKLVAAGHELGNHSYTHARMLARSLDFIRDEIEQTDAEIRRAGYRGQIQFRPPYGKRLLALPWVLHEMGRRLTLWDVAPDSEDPTISPARLVERIRDEVRPGSIVLMHVMGGERDTSRAALPDAIHELENLGYRFVTLSELLEH